MKVYKSWLFLNEISYFMFFAFGNFFASAADL